MKHPIQQYKLLMIGSLFGLVVWILSPSVRAEGPAPKTTLPIPEYEAEYKISWHNIPAGSSKHRLTLRSDGVYHLDTQSAPYIKMIPLGYIEKSDFKYNEGKIRPLNYYYDNKEGGRHKKGFVAFDWKKQIVGNPVRKDPWKQPLKEGTLDKLTQALQCRLDLLNGQKNAFVYTVADVNQVTEYHYTLLDRAPLKTNLGVLSTLKLEYISKKNGNKTWMWLATDYQYLPVKVQHFRKNKMVGDGEIISYTPKNRT